MKTIIEPFRVKVVEPIKMTTLAERELYLKAAAYNLFLLKAENEFQNKTDTLACALTYIFGSLILPGVHIRLSEYAA